MDYTKMFELLTVKANLTHDDIKARTEHLMKYLASEGWEEGKGILDDEYQMNLVLSQDIGFRITMLHYTISINWLIRGITVDGTTTYFNLLEDQLQKHIKDYVVCKADAFKVLLNSV